MWIAAQRAAANVRSDWTMKTNTIEFYVDEEHDQIIVVEQPSNDATSRGSTGAPEKILELNLSDIRDKSPAEAQRNIGRLVLTFLNSRSSRGLSLPRDKEDEQRLDQKHFEDLARDVNPGDSRGQHELAMSYIARGIRNKSWEDIETGEQWLLKAIANGHPEAVAYQAEWAILKPRLRHKIKGS